MFGVNPMHVSRPVRKPTEREVRLVLARDLSRDKTRPHGFDQDKFVLMLQLPLFEVALDGSDGMLAATTTYAQELSRRVVNAS